MISGPADKDRTCFRALFRPGATLTALMVDKNGILKPTDMTVEDWIERVKKRGSTLLYERQVKFTSETYGSIAHLWSTYEIRDTPEGAAKARGINSIQAINDGESVEGRRDPLASGNAFHSDTREVSAVTHDSHGS